MHTAINKGQSSSRTSRGGTNISLIQFVLIKYRLKPCRPLESPSPWSSKELKARDKSRPGYTQEILAALPPRVLYTRPTASPQRRTRKRRQVGTQGRTGETRVYVPKQIDFCRALKTLTARAPKKFPRRSLYSSRVKSFRPRIWQHVSRDGAPAAGR